MYKPAYTENVNPDLVRDLISEYPLGLLLSTSNGQVDSNYLPFLFQQTDRESFLITHMSRSNPQVKNLDQQVLVSFQGPDRYISPTIYSGNLNVPTWSYAAVQFRGQVQLISDKQGIRQILDQSVQFFESRNQTAWRMDLPPHFQDRLEAAIIGVRIKVTVIDSKFKLSQNRDREDYNSALQFFKNSQREKDQEFYRWMLKTKCELDPV